MSDVIRRSLTGGQCVTGSDPGVSSPQVHCSQVFDRECAAVSMLPSVAEVGDVCQGRKPLLLGPFCSRPVGSGYVPNLR